MKHAVLFVIAFFCVLISANGQWGTLNDWKAIGGGGYSDIAFATKQIGFTTGGIWPNSYTLKTTDGGENWRKMPTYDNEFYESICFTDTRHGWMANWSKILRTTDSGESWQLVLNSVGGNPGSYFFLDSLNAFITRHNGGNIFRTNNGGISWDSLGTPWPETRWIDALHFHDHLHGWAIGTTVTDSSYIFRTADGGLTWSPVYKKNSWSSYGDWIHFTDLQNGWTNYFHSDSETQAVLGRTTDGGNTWTFQSFIDTIKYTYLTDIHFISPDTGFLASNRKIYKTTNGGNFWEISDDLGNDSTDYSSFSKIHFIDNQIGFEVGGINLIRKTTNGGISWEEKSRFPSGGGISIWPMDSLTAFISGSKGFIGKTLNQGTTWSTIKTPANCILTNIQFVNPSTGLAVGDTGTIVKTTNGGTNWMAKPSGTMRSLKKLVMINTQLGWICGDTGTLLKTTDEGETWQPQTIGSTVNFTVIQFLDSLTGWVSGQGGAIFRTNDGGQTWQDKSTPQNVNLASLFFLDKYNGWALSGNPWTTIWKTNNGGDSWIKIPSTGISGWVGESPVIRFSDIQNGWILCHMFGTFRTTDGGWTWKIENYGIDPSPDLTDLKFNNGKAWASGSKFWGGVVMVRSVPVLPQFHGKGSQIVGKVFTNATGNCLPNPNEELLDNQLVKAIPGPYYSNSTSDGTYHISLPVDTLQPRQYTISVKPGYSNYLATPVCPPGNAFSVTVDTLPDTLIGPDFGIKQLDCHFLNVELYSRILRPCRKGITSIYYENRGKAPAPHAFVLVEFPKWIKPISANKPHIVINDSTWRFNLDTIQNGMGGYINILDSLVCGQPQVIGQTICRKVSIFPQSGCPPPPGWNGASLNTKGVCNQGLVRFSIFNEGTADMTDSVDYVVMLDSIQLKAGRTKLAMGDSLHFGVNPQGREATLLVNQVGMHPLSSFLRTTISGCNDTTFHLIGIPDYFPHPQTPVVKQDCQIIRGSWDPNDKQVSPRGITARHVVKPGTQLDYTIRFQNTGNDTAFYAMVLDSLDRNLDPETFELAAVSHPHQFELRTDVNGRTYLRWVFDNILLPDSNTNELLSHGFIQYRISPKPGITLGTEVTNQAWIFFDQNPPVHSNPTLTTFDNLVITDTSLNNQFFNAPNLTTSLPAVITSTTANSGGFVDSDGGAPISARGVVWSTTQQPTVALATKTLDGTGVGSFSSNLTNLLPSTTYYVRAYATNIVGTRYGEERQLTTLAPATLPTVMSLNISGIGTTMATASSKITNDGGATVTARGVVWDTLPQPTISLPTKTMDGADTGTFSSNLTGLLPGTLYYVRSYATNTVGTAYGAEQQFSTLIIGLKSELEGKTLTVLPNPFSNNVLLQSTSEEEISVIICDVLGKVLLFKKFRGLAELSMGHLPSGIYFLKLPDQNQTLKLVKQE